MLEFFYFFWEGGLTLGYFLRVEMVLGSSVPLLLVMVWNLLNIWSYPVIFWCVIVVSA